MSKTIVLVHGAWLTPASWDRFRSRYEANGYTVVTPAWPHVEGPASDQRSSPNPALARIGIKEIADHYEAVIRGLDEPPIIMGHSFGGLIAQLLLDRGLGCVGVAIDPAPPFGVLASRVAVVTSLPVFTAWNAWNRVLSLSPEGFAAGFANTLPAERMASEYDAQIVPSPGRIFFQAVLGIGARLDFDSATRAPLLFLAAEFDRTSPTPMVRSNFRRQSRAASPTAFREFKGRSHYLCNEAGWEEVADYALDWAVAHVEPAAHLRLVAPANLVAA